MSRRGVSLESVTPELAARIVADSRDRVAWVRARSRGITATDVASLTSDSAIARAADAKLMGSGFSGNAYTAHGRAPRARDRGVGRRDPRHPAVVGAVPRRRREAPPRDPRRHRRRRGGRVQLCEIKTTNKSWRSIPRSYLRQVWWQQHVLGAERTLVAWEEHDALRPGRRRAALRVGRARRGRDRRSSCGSRPRSIDELHRRTTAGRAGSAPAAHAREPFRASPRRLTASLAASATELRRRSRTRTAARAPTRQRRHRSSLIAALS